MSVDDLYANFWAVPCGCDGHGDHAACTKACRQWGCRHPKGADVVTAFEGGTRGNAAVREEINALRRNELDPTVTVVDQDRDFEVGEIRGWNQALDAVLEVVGEPPYPNRPDPARPPVPADLHVAFEALRKADQELRDVATDAGHMPLSGTSPKDAHRLAKRHYRAIAAVNAARVAVINTTRAQCDTHPSVPENPDTKRLDTLRKAFEGGAWTAATSASPDAWTRERPSVGQCAVTALVVQDMLGGVLLRTVNAGTSHYYNLLPGDIVVDLTRDQFDAWEPTAPVETRTREYVLSFAETATRYATLVQALAEQHVPSGR